VAGSLFPLSSSAPFRDRTDGKEEGSNDGDHERGHEADGEKIAHRALHSMRMGEMNVFGGGRLPPLRSVPCLQRKVRNSKSPFACYHPRMHALAGLPDRSCEDRAAGAAALSGEAEASS